MPATTKVKSVLQTSLSLEDDVEVYPIIEDDAAPVLEKAGKNAPRITPADIEALIDKVEYHRPEGTTWISCYIHLRNGHISHGFSRPVSDANFIEKYGKDNAYKEAFNALWGVVAYELRHRLYLADSQT